MIITPKMVKGYRISRLCMTQSKMYTDMLELEFVLHSPTLRHVMPNIVTDITGKCMMDGDVACIIELLGPEISRDAEIEMEKTVSNLISKMADGDEIFVEASC